MRWNLLGGIFLISGTSIGAGMLALPVVTGESGFWPAMLIYALCYLFMTVTGLLLADLILAMPPGANLLSVAERYWGWKGRLFVFGVYLFLFYSLSVAYIAGGGLLLWQESPLKGQALFLLLLLPILYRGSLFVEKVNGYLMAGLIAAYLLLIFLGIPHISSLHLARKEWSSLLLGLPVIFTSFSYQGTVPSLVALMERDRRAIFLAIIGGTTLTFFIYFLWQLVILGIIPAEELLSAKAEGLTAIAPLAAFTLSPHIYPIGKVFAFLAIATSFLGVNLGMIDFWSDGLQIGKRGWGKVKLFALAFFLPITVAALFPSLFLKALGLAGGIGCALLLGVFPLLLSWQTGISRRAVLIPLLAFVVFELLFELANIIS